jgi:hypothetical protein
VDLDPQLKGALITGSLAVVGCVARLFWNYIKGLRLKIRVLKAEEQTRWEQKVDRLEQTLATTNVALVGVQKDLARLSDIAIIVKKLGDDITAFHVWKRVKFPDLGRENGGSEI